MPVEEKQYVEIIKEIAELKGKLAVHDGRFLSGMESFQNLREEQEEIRKTVVPKPMTRLQLFGFIAGPILVVGLLFYQFVWQASRYPDRDEFDELDKKLRSMEIQQIEFKSEINQKLDELLRTRP
jgi:hypothetical protein